MTLPEKEILDSIVDQFHEIQSHLLTEQDPQEIIRLSKDRARIQAAFHQIQAYRKILEEKSQAERLLQDPELDPELRELANTEIQDLDLQIQALETRIAQELEPKNILDTRPAVLEIRAGVGGQEAALFVNDLVRMYKRYAQTRDWEFDIVDERITDMGGSRESTVSIQGKGVFALLKYEAGVHRVQRVPETETQGRIHTSTVTVAILPEPDEVEVQILQKDIRIDSFRASGPGGQHRNKTDSAIRLTHIPTGIVVISAEKSQHVNRDRTMNVLRARLFAQKEAEHNANRSDERRSQVGTGDRSQRIRTYNYPQERITDHRIGLTVQNLHTVLDGELDPILEKLQEYKL